jgi:hydroxypyruvate isomerase
MLGAVAGAVSANTLLGGAAPVQSAGRLRQSVCRWPYDGIPLRDFASTCARLGFGAIDLLHADEWAVVAEFGLACSTGYPSRRRDFIARGFNDPSSHALLLSELEQTLPLARENGVRNVITMFGNRNGRTEREGIDACIDGLRRIAPLAEEQGVTVILEMLNSKVDHKDYQADSTRFGVEVVRGVASPRVRLLYDIYHMQVMEGDVIRTIRENHAWFAHYHTAGNPGRNELSDGQELQYAAIATAIADIGFDGWVAHEFIPTTDVAAGLTQARDRFIV